MNTEQEQVGRGIRIGSMIIDHVIMTIIATIIVLPVILLGPYNVFQVSHYSSTRPDFPAFTYVLLLGLTIYFCKDAIHGRSIAKLILGLQVIDKKNGLTANPIKCFARNTFLILWPIEVIMILINPSSRLGDKIAGTEVVYFDKTRERPKLNIQKLFLSFVLAYAFLYLITLPFTYAMQPSSEMVKFEESSYNSSLSAAVNRAFSDSLKVYLNPDIRIYNKTTESDKMYISAIFNLNKDYDINDEDFQKLRDYSEYLFSQLIDGPYFGRMIFAYRHGTKVNVRESWFSKK